MSQREIIRFWWESGL